MVVKRDRSHALARLRWWASFGIVLLFAGFALASAAAEVLHRLGVVTDVDERSAPLFFIVHALAGTVTLVAGPLQWVTARAERTRHLHRVVGRAYLIGVMISAATALRLAVSFDVPLAARYSFATLAVVWAGVTLVGFRRIRVRAVASHRAWMTRSYALTLFFITGPIGMSLAESGI